MRVDAVKSSKKSGFPASSLLPRIAIYSVFVAGIIASFYDFKLNAIAPPSGRASSEARQQIALINQLQLAYYKENGQFCDSLEKLSAGMQQQTDNYNYAILSANGPVQTLQNQREPAHFESTIAVARTHNSDGKSYIGAVFAFKENDRDRSMVAAICESDGTKVTLISPTFDGSKIHCPPRTTMLSNKNNFDNLR